MTRYVTNDEAVPWSTQRYLEALEEIRDLIEAFETRYETDPIRREGLPDVLEMSRLVSAISRVVRDVL